MVKITIEFNKENDLHITGAEFPQDIPPSEEA